MQRVAHGESLRQIARSYHTSYEAVRRVLHAARKELVAYPDSPADLPPGDAEEEFSKERILTPVGRWRGFREAPSPTLDQRLNSTAIAFKKQAARPVREANQLEWQ